MQLRVLNVGYPFAPVGPNAVGGAEQVLSQIDAALTAAGQESFVLGCDGSIARGTLFTEPVPALISENVREEQRRKYRARIEKIVREHKIDLIHFHGLDFYQYLPACDIPLLATLHLPPDWYPQSIFEPQAPKLWLHCVSDAQDRVCPRSDRLLPPIANGVRLPVRQGISRRTFAAAIGRICPEKGFHLALDAAANAGVPCFLAGKAFPYQEHLNYFEREIAPRLNAQRRFIGPVGPRQKVRLLSSAGCLLVPSLAAETSSLVAMEALACGTPVIAFPSGALPSLIVDGVTGFVVRNVTEMAEAIRQAESLSAEDCRAYAREHFCAERMTRRYLELYDSLLSSTAATFESVSSA